MEYPVTTEETKNFYGFTVGYAFMSMVDLVQTLYGVNNGFEEGNPMVKPFASNNISLSVIKILGTLGVTLMLIRLWVKHDNNHKAVVAIPKIVFGMQTIAVCWNFLVLMTG